MSVSNQGVKSALPHSATLLGVRRGYALRFGSMAVVITTSLLLNNPALARVPPPEEMASHVLMTDEARIAGGASVAIRPFVNENLPDACSATSSTVIVCDRSYAPSNWPISSQYPFWLRVHVFESSSFAQQEFVRITRYRPQQSDVVDTRRSDADAMSLIYSHSWGNDTSWAIRKAGRYVVESTCSDGGLALDPRLLAECAEGVVNAQLGRLESSLGPAVSVPGAPEAVSAIWDGNAVKVSWLPPSDDGGASLQRYIVSRDSGEQVCVLDATKAPATSCLVKLTPTGEESTFAVHAENAAGRSNVAGISNRVSMRRVLGMPRQVKVEARGDTVRVSWRREVGGEQSKAARYLVTANPGGRVCRTRTLTCEFRNLDPGRTYIFQVVGMRDGVQSAPVTSKRVLLQEQSRPSRDPGSDSPAAPPPPEAKPEQQFS